MNKIYSLILLASLLSMGAGAWGETYVKVADNSDLVVGGTYIIATTSAVATAYSSGGLTTTATGFTESFGTITTSTATPIEFTLGVEKGNYTLKMSDGKYLGYSGSNTGFENIFTSGQYSSEQWIIAYNADYAMYTIVNVQTSNRYIGATTNQFKCYTNMPYYPPATLYKKPIPTPSITSDPETVTVTAEGVADGSITLSYSDFTASSASVNLYNDQACTEAFSGAWISNLTLNASFTTVTFSVAPNSQTTPRTAYLLVTASDENSGNQSLVIPLSQAAYVEPTGIFEAYSGTITDGEYVITGEYSSSLGAMNTTESNTPRLQITEVSVTNDQIANPSSDIIWHIHSGTYCTVYSESAGKYVSATSSEYQATLALTAGNDKALWAITENAGDFSFQNKHSNLFLRRQQDLGFGCYPSGTLKLYKQTSYPVRVAANSWASFAPGSDVIIPDDPSLNVYSAQLTDVSTLTANKINTTSGVKIPAGVGVLIKNTSDEEKTYDFLITTGAPDLSNNQLKGTVVTTPASFLKSASGDYIMVLKKGETTFIHYTGANMPANKAYLLIPAANVPTSAPAIHFVVDESGNATALPTHTANSAVTKFFRGGRLLIQKDGVVYDTLGRLIR